MIRVSTQMQRLKGVINAAKSLGFYRVARKLAKDGAQAPLLYPNSLTLWKNPLVKPLRVLMTNGSLK